MLLERRKEEEEAAWGRPAAAVTAHRQDPSQEGKRKRMWR
jgi:hypothetical protein